MSNRVLFSVLFLSASLTVLPGQTIVEHGAIDGKTAAAAAAAGTSVVGVLGQLGRTIDKKTEPPKPAAKPKPATPPSASDTEGPHGAPDVRPPSGGGGTGSSTAAAVAKPEPVSFSLIIEGMERAELLKLFGKPSMSVSGIESSALFETYWYQTATESVTVVLRDGKVTSVTHAEKSLSASAQ